MKKPYLNQDERRIMKIDCYQGATLKLHFASKKLKRDVFKEFGIVAGWIVWRKVKKIQIFESDKKKQTKLNKNGNT